MAFTGTAVIKEVTDGLVRITGLSLAGSASGTIGLHEAVTPPLGTPPDVRLPAAYRPREYTYLDVGDVSLQDSIQIWFNYLAPGTAATPISIVKTGDDPRNFIALLANTAGTGPASILGTAQTFGVLAASTVTNTGGTVITGDLGLSPGTSVTGIPPGTVIGTLHVTDATAAQAKIDATAAYVALAALTPAIDLTGQDPGGLTLPPGNYNFTSSAQLTGTLILDAGGDPSATWVFQIGSTLTTAGASAVSLINSALAANVFWQVGSSATIGSTTTFVGTVIALTSVTAVTGASVLNGRLMALTGAVTLDNNAITVPAAAGPPAATGALEIYVRFH